MRVVEFEPYQAILKDGEFIALPFDQWIPNDRIEWNKIVGRRQFTLKDNQENVIELADQYLRYTAQYNTDNTTRARAKQLKTLYIYLNEFNLKVQDMDDNRSDHFFEWYRGDYEIDGEYRLGQKHSNKSANYLRINLNDYYKWLIRKGYVKENPFESNIFISMPNEAIKGMLVHTHSGIVKKSRHKFKEKKVKREAFTKEQEQRIRMSFSNERDVLIFDLMLYSGMRISEALSIKINQIPAGDNTQLVQELFIEDTIEDYLRGINLKSGSRNVLIPTPIYNRLLKYQMNEADKLMNEADTDHSYLFVNFGNRNKGEPVTPDNYRKAMNKSGNIARVEAFPHKCRHTYATRLAESGASVEIIQEALGHSHAATAMEYVHQSDFKKKMTHLMEAVKISMGRHYDCSCYLGLRT